jgi:hypothetical protein
MIAYGLCCDAGFPVCGGLMDMTGRPWEIADNHVLDDPESGYLVRLKRNLN